MAGPLERLFDKLVKQRMAGAALPIAGISVGVFVLELGNITPPPFDFWVAAIGLSVITVCAILLVAAIAVYVWKWARQMLKNR